MDQGQPWKKAPPFKCLFCLSTNAPFTRIEHPIPESLGNDDTTLDVGYVCDVCNQYFGSKVESLVINIPPFAVERVRVDILTKKGKHPHFKAPPHVEIYPTPIRSQVILSTSPEYWRILQTHSVLLLPRSAQHDFLTVRFLSKMGLELILLAGNVNPYDKQFDAARSYARAPKRGAVWNIAHGIYPRQEDLIIEERIDEISPIVTEQLYQYELGIMPNGNIIFCFMYRTHVFACNLSESTLGDYICSFNFQNQFKIGRIEVKNV